MNRTYVLALLCAAVGCGAQEEVTVGGAQESASVATVPAYAQTSLLTGKDGVLSIDASGRRVVFPLPLSPRVFKTEAELFTFAEKTLGAKQQYVKDKSGVQHAVGFELRAKQAGSSYWNDAKKGVLYSVADPVLAWLGGASGKIIINGVERCLDPDQRCSGVPSYLTPVVLPTLASHVDQCRDPLCTEYQSFFNQVDLGFFKYARHGANTRMTAGSAAESLRVAPCASSAPDDPNSLVSGLTVSIRTGSDDLRGGSVAVAVLHFGGLDMPLVVNSGSGFGSNTLNTVTVAVPGGPVRLGDISQFALGYQSGPCVFCTTDNWDVNQLLVTWFGPDGHGGTMVARDGAPFMRFTGDRPEWRTDLTHGMLPSETPVDSVRVTVRTGADDLRGGSDARVRIGLPSGLIDQSLNGGAGWPNGSVHTASVSLPPGTTLGQLATFGLGYHSGDCFACTTDNWNVDELLVEVSTPTGVRTLIERSATPFLRFTGSFTDWSVDVAAGMETPLCGVRVPGLHLAVTASNLVSFVNDPGFTGPPHWEALPLAPASADGLDQVETAAYGFSLAVEITGEGGIEPGSAPSFTVIEASGVCSAHDSLGMPGHTGNGDHEGAADVGLCP